MTHKTSILIVEDEKNICDFISATLSSQGYKTTVVHNGADALSVATSQCPDLILLDLGLPDMDGTEIIKQIRTWASIPIIVISARSQEQEKVNALDLGADDYLTKPIGTSELMARIRTALRHSNKLNTDALLYKRPYQAKDLVIDFDKHLVTLAGKEIHLTQIEFKIIALLAKNSGKVMTYDTIIENICLRGRRQQHSPREYGPHPAEAGVQSRGAQVYLHGDRHWLPDGGGRVDLRQHARQSVSAPAGLLCRRYAQRSLKNR